MTENEKSKLENEINKLNNYLLKKQVQENWEALPAQEILEISCRKGFLEIIKKLVESNPSNINPFNYSTLFVTACLGNQQGVVELFLNLEERDINRTAYGSYHTPLSAAIETDNLNLVETLLKNGADPNSNLKRGYSPFIIACLKGSVPMVELLIQNGAKVDVEEEILLKETNLRGFWPLYTACIERHYEVALLLLRNGAKTVEAKKERVNNMQPLHLLCAETERSNNVKQILQVAEELIMRGAGINEPVTKYSDDHEAPLHLAVKERFHEMVWLLVAFGGSRLIEVPINDYNKESTPWNLCHDTETKKALINKWSPKNHHKYPKVIRSGILCFMLVLKRLKLDFDSLLRHKIIQFIAFGWLPHIHEI